MRIEVYDLGVAVINGTFDIEVPAEVPLEMAARKVKEIVSLGPDGVDEVSSPIAEMFRQLSKETTREFRAAVKASSLPDWPPRPWLPTSDPDEETSRDWGRLLWLHPVNMLAIEDSETHRSKAKDLAPTFSKSIKVPDGRFVSGIGWSAIVTRQDRSARHLPLKLLQLHWAYFALYMEIDRGLMVILDRDKSSTKKSLLSESEDSAKETFDDYLRVMKARARVDQRWPAWAATSKPFGMSSPTCRGSKHLSMESTGRSRCCRKSPIGAFRMRPRRHHGVRQPSSGS
jgi:hypothetical protein